MLNMKLFKELRKFQEKERSLNTKKLAELNMFQKKKKLPTTML